MNILGRDRTNHCMSNKSCSSLSRDYTVKRLCGHRVEHHEVILHSSNININFINFNVNKKIKSFIFVQGINWKAFKTAYEE